MWRWVNDIFMISFISKRDADSLRRVTTLKSNENVSILIILYTFATEKKNTIKQIFKKYRFTCRSHE